MYIRILGSLLIVLGCGGYGIMLGAANRREVRFLRQLRSVLETMESELSYRMTPLPELCIIGAAQAPSMLGEALTALGNELDKLYSSDVEACMDAVLEKYADIPSQCAAVLSMLGRSLGRFDLDGQRNALESCKRECEDLLLKIETDQPQRMRNYRTLGFCAGAALAILLF